MWLRPRFLPRVRQTQVALAILAEDVAIDDALHGLRKFVQAQLPQLDLARSHFVVGDQAAIVVHDTYAEHHVLERGQVEMKDLVVDGIQVVVFAAGHLLAVVEVADPVVLFDGQRDVGIRFREEILVGEVGETVQVNGEDAPALGRFDGLLRAAFKGGLRSAAVDRRLLVLLELTVRLVCHRGGAEAHGDLTPRCEEPAFAVGVVGITGTDLLVRDAVVRNGVRRYVLRLCVGAIAVRFYLWLRGLSRNIGRAIRRRLLHRLGLHRDVGSRRHGRWLLVWGVGLTGDVESLLLLVWKIGSIWAGVAWLLMLLARDEDGGHVWGGHGRVFCSGRRRARGVRSEERALRLLFRLFCAREREIWHEILLNRELLEVTSKLIEENLKSNLTREYICSEIDNFI